MNSINFRPNEAGNILIYILGAIFLLGLLVVIVKGSSTPGSNIDKETLMIRISEVQSYGQELERAVAYIMRNGHSETDIRFAHPDASSAYGDITDTPSRQIFATTGGGAKYREPPEDIQVTPTDWIFTAANSISSVGSGDQAGSSQTELIAMLTNVTKEFCIEVNDRTDVDNPSGNPPQDETAFRTTEYPFIGDYTWDGIIKDAAATAILNTPEACIEGDSTPPAGTYHYYRVLLAR